MISTHPPTRTPVARPLLAGGLMFALAGLMFDAQGLKTFLSQPSQSQGSARRECAAIIQTDARLSRQQLAELLAIPERDAKSRVRQVVSEPYCKLPTLNVRAGVEAEREAYPLEFDPATTLVILYENDEYAGYRFSFN